MKRKQKQDIIIDTFRNTSISDEVFEAVCNMVELLNKQQLDATIEDLHGKFDVEIKIAYEMNRINIETDEEIK